MSALFTRLLSHIYPSQHSHRIVILGLDDAGKTTLLYFLKAREFIHFGPSIGTNVEDIEVPLPVRSGGSHTGPTSKSFKMILWDIGTGCADLRRMYGMVRHYLNRNEALVWVVDASDRKRLAESVEVLRDILGLMDSNLEQRNETDKMRVPILILANKTDKPDTLSVDQVRIAFKDTVAGRLVGIYKSQVTTASCNDLSSTGLPDAFDWLDTTLGIVKALTSEAERPGKSDAKPVQVQPQDQSLRAPNVLAHKLESWLTRSESDEDPSDEEYLERFGKYDLPEWDHYTHIRIAWIILTKYGRQEGKDNIFEGIEAYIVNAKDTKGRAFHLTMTYFWIQIVHLGIRNTPPPPSALDSSTSTVTSAKELAPFTRFLLVNPHVVDGNLWSDYYSKEVLMGSKARTEMVLPDKKALPNLVGRDAVAKFGR